MLEDLMMLRPTFFDDCLTTLAGHFFDGLKEYEEGPNFVEEDNEYVMRINKDGRELKDFSIEVEDETFIKVTYFKQTENSSNAFELKEFLPLHSDASTLVANEVGNNIEIRVKKKDE